LSTEHGADRDIGRPTPDGISAVMITRDAAETFAESLTSLEAFPEVLVFDNGSTDDTAAIARRFGNVRFEQGEFIGFGPTRNRAASLARYDWIFMLDSDEIASQTLVASVSGARRDDPARVYIVERHNYLMGRRVLHSGWGRDRLPRVYHRGHHRYSDAVVHENIILGATSRPQRLEGELKHLAVRELGQFLVKVNRYSELRSQTARHVHTPAVVLLLAGWAFFRTYVLRLGFLDGWRGLVIAWSNANGVFFKYMKPYANRRAAERQ
jgi:glycosyltransferase involved in cell wall biosynthesis